MNDRSISLDSTLRVFYAGVILAVASSLSSGAASTSPRYPAARTQAVKDTYFGTTVADPYRWLEDAKSPEVRAWAAAETKVARDFIDARPARATFKKRVRELLKGTTFRFDPSIRGTHWVYLRETPPQQQPVIIARDGFAAPERVIFDPTSMMQDGTQPSVESSFISPDGSKLAFAVQFGGSEDETLHVVDTSTGTLLPDTLSHVGGGISPVALSWDEDGKGFLHTQWPKNADGTLRPPEC